ncbi:hypothetical protein KPH14_012454 [Odynerus spinipes]|uniref:Uncharacterized protein n=1 Tax=Odynerus spinipes TaxID=1348599 RepID=A0AAD9VMS9_9HYME|nr:hypothetical protein KPH14_012454 [Odynerus spinipes]
MLILYMGFLKDKEYSSASRGCKPGIKGLFTDKKGENDNMCSTADQRDATAQQQPGQRRMSAHAKGGCSWYANRGRCCRRERCYPRVIASEYLVKSNNGIFLSTRGCISVCVQKNMRSF